MPTNALREILREAENLRELDFDYPTASYFGPSPKVDEFLDAAVGDEERDDDEETRVVLPRALREIEVP